MIFVYQLPVIDYSSVFQHHYNQITIQLQENFTYLHLFFSLLSRIKLTGRSGFAGKNFTDRFKESSLSQRIFNQFATETRRHKEDKD